MLSRQRILGAQKLFALTVVIPMSYKDQLNPWVIHKLLPDLQRSTIQRFRRRNEAEAYLKLLRQTQPKNEYAIAFESN